MDTRPIGVFDSGMGGLSILKDLTVQLPKEDLIYFGDTARLPYGPRSKETIIRYSKQCASFLISKGVKMIVVACNTASALALKELQESFDLPILGVIEPGSRAAAEVSENHRIGVIGTEGTVRSKSYESGIRKHLPDAEILALPCPLFVHLVEEGWADTDIAELTARKYLLELAEYDVDTLVLGCTHYPALRYTINKVLGNDIRLINPAYETAKATRVKLEELGLLNEEGDFGKQSYYVSDSPEKFRRIGGNIVRMEISYPEKVDIDQ